MVASGGDKIIARKNHKDKGEFINHATPFSFVNDMPKIVPYDDGVNNRVSCVEYKKTFTENPNPDNDKELLADPTVKDKFAQEEYKNAFFGILIDAFQSFLKNGQIEPESVKTAKSEWIEDENGIAGILKQKYEFTMDFENDFVPFPEIENFLKKGDKKIQMGKKKIGIELTRLLNGKECVPKRVSGYDKAVTVRFGMREKKEEV
jgi:phage/plasmid-associated DNA primase